jgi:hypothetical protein
MVAMAANHVSGTAHTAFWHPGDMGCYPQSVRGHVGHLRCAPLPGLLVHLGRLSGVIWGPTLHLAIWTPPYPELPDFLPQPCPKEA